MTRIRTIKPEFWDSPSTAKAGPWARLLFIALWNWADDYGRGTANLKELEGFAFPNDDKFTDSSGNTVNFRELVAEVSECFGVVFYEVDGRPFYAVPTWDEHQRNERRAKRSKYPAPPSSSQVKPHVAEVHGISATRERKTADAPRSSGPGTGEQGNRGTGRERRKTSLPPDWKPTDTHAQKCAQLGIDMNWEATKFKDNAEAKDHKYVNWDKAFHTWLNRAKDFQPKHQGGDDLWSRTGNF